MRLVSVFVLVLSMTVAAHSQSVRDSMTVNDDYGFTSANRVLMWFANNGALAYNPMTDGAGVEWPRGSGRNLVYKEGLVFGGRVAGEARVGGSTYRQGMQAGCILEDGRADDPGLPLHRIYRAHRFDAGWWGALGEDEKLRLRTDMIEWPTELGAPWVDANNNGVYDPDVDSWIRGESVDTPALPGDEVFWYVSNDLDPARTSNLYGTQPSGIEVQTFIWSSAGHPLLENVVFREHTIINKHQDLISGMSLASWEDTDIGWTEGDHTGIDTSLGLMYAYNGLPFDAMYGIPPATGSLWLQTPVVPRSGSTARFGRGSREGYANLPLSSFVYYINGDIDYSDPDLGTTEGAIQMLENMAGNLWNGTGMTDPVSGQRTIFSLSGDPVFAKGWIDGLVHPPGDRRQMSVCGGFDFAQGDTQKVLLARIAVDGPHHLLSVRALRNAARQLHDIYRNLPMGAPVPVFTSQFSYPDAGSAELRVTGGPFPVGTTEVDVLLRGSDGTESARTPLVDDGGHGDVTPNDGIFSGALTVTAQPSGADLYIESRDESGTKSWFVDSEIPLPGPVHVRIDDVVSDSRNFDGKANPGENVRVSLRIENRSAGNLGPWHLFLHGKTPLLRDHVTLRGNGVVAAGEDMLIPYDASDANSYVSVTIPANTLPGTVLRLPCTLISENNAAWNDTLLLDVEGFTQQPLDGLLAHVQGNAFGSLGYVVVDREALTDHQYRVYIDGEDTGEKKLRLEDVTLGTTLRSGMPMPDRWAHNSVTVDGFRIAIGTAFDQLVYDQAGDMLDSFEEVPFGFFSSPDRAWFNPNRGIYLRTGADFFGSHLGVYETVPVRLVFDRTAGQKAMAWLRDGTPNYAYEGYFDIPLRAYDISDTANPRQLMVGFVEQNGRPSHNSTWMPTEDSGDREYLFIFADDYSGSVDPKFQTAIVPAMPELDVIYGLWPVRNPQLPMFEDGDTYTIHMRIPVSKRDVYILAQPRLMDVESTPSSPAAIALHPNYPNPFCADGNGTIIAFDTHRDGHARISLHDMLGRHVATVLDQELLAGSHRFAFEAAGLRAGLYLLSLEHGGERVSRTITITR